MERTIGNLGEEIRQPSNPYANLSQRGLLRCQVNALTAMIPDLGPPAPSLPRGAIDLGQGYVLLRAQDRYDRPMRPQEAGALLRYLGSAAAAALSTVTGVQRLPDGLGFDFQMVRWLGLAGRNPSNPWKAQNCS